MAKSIIIAQYVSILVLVERPFGLKRQPPYRDRPQVSILVLVERPFGPQSPQPLPPVCLVSILVLVERPFGLQNMPAYTWTRRVSILVLVERPFGLGGRHKKSDGLKFQSLFWWRGHLDAFVAHLSYTARQFQSLFWWRGHLDYHVHVHSFRGYFVFQSLFWWRGHLDPPSHAVTVSTSLVSILVLVERPFGLGQWSRLPGRLPGFNPCFGGEAIWTPM